MVTLQILVGQYTLPPAGMFHVKSKSENGHCSFVGCVDRCVMAFQMNRSERLPSPRSTNYDHLVNEGDQDRVQTLCRDED